MGCGSSSLKGEKVEGVGQGETAPPPAKKVKTNFSDVDFSSNASADRRATMAVAPDEHRRPTKISEASAEGGATAPGGAGAGSVSKENTTGTAHNNNNDDGGQLQPYRSNDAADRDGLADPRQQKVEATQPIRAQDTTTPEIDASSQPK